MRTTAQRLWLSLFLVFALCLGFIPPKVVLAQPASVTVTDPKATVDKTASELTKNPQTNDLETKVSLTFSGTTEDVPSDVVFVLDKSGAADVLDEALAFLDELKQQADTKGVKARVGVVLFNRVGNIRLPLTDISTGYDEIKAAMQSSVHMGTNMHAGLLAGQQMLDEDTSIPNNHKHMVLISDGATYLYSKNNDYTTSYTRSFGDPKAQTNPATGNPFLNGSDKKGGIWEYQSREYNLNEAIKFSAASGNVTLLETYLNQKRLHDAEYEQYEYEYNASSAYLGIGRKTTPIEENAVANIDAAWIHAIDTFDKIAEKYRTHVFFKNVADFDGSTLLKYMTRNTGGLSQNFVQLERALSHSLSDGSFVTDVVGDDFDFVHDFSRVTVKVGNEELTGEKISDNKYGFGKRADGTYRYELTYSEADKTLKLDIHETITADKPATLSFYEKLKDPPVTPGTYTYDTNKSATLTVINSGGNSVGRYNFPKPQVTYVAVAQGTVTARYVDENGAEIDDSVTTTGDVDSPYTTQQKDIDGYTFKEMADDSAAANGTYIEGTLTVTYVYHKNPTPTPNKPDQPNKPNQPENPKKPSQPSPSKGRGVIPGMGDVGAAAATGAVALGGGLLILDLRRKLRNSHK